MSHSEETPSYNVGLMKLWRTASDFSLVALLICARLALVLADGEHPKVLRATFGGRYLRDVGRLFEHSWI
jgi:hypothetical protein